MSSAKRISNAGEMARRHWLEVANRIKAEKEREHRCLLRHAGRRRERAKLHRSIMRVHHTFLLVLLLACRPVLSFRIGVILTHRGDLLRRSPWVSSRIFPILFMNESNDEDDDDEIQQAYGNRSLYWTNNYRNLMPYEKARRSVMDLGLRSKDDWDEYVADGKRYHGPYLPNHPDEMYELEWISWDEFLGITRPHNETRDIVQNVLKLKDMDDYVNFVAADTKRARGLRIPAKPEIVYRNKGWVSMEHFFGK